MNLQIFRGFSFRWLCDTIKENQICGSYFKLYTNPIFFLTKIPPKPKKKFDGLNFEFAIEKKLNFYSNLKANLSQKNYFNQFSKKEMKTF